MLNLPSCCGGGSETRRGACGGGAVQTGSAITSVNTIGDVYAGVNWTLALNTSTLLPPYLAFSKYYNPVSPSRGDNFTNSLMRQAMRGASRVMTPLPRGDNEGGWEV